MAGRNLKRSVFVGNIPYDATEEQLTEKFKEAGPVVHFRLVFDRDTGKPKGYGFCEYMDEESAMCALRNLANTEMLGRMLRVDYADKDARDNAAAQALQSGNAPPGMVGGGPVNQNQGPGPWNPNQGQNMQQMQVPVGGVDKGNIGRPNSTQPQQAFTQPMSMQSGYAPTDPLCIAHGPSVATANAAMAVEATVKGLSVEVLKTTLQDMAAYCKAYPSQARYLLLQNPQLAYALVEAQKVTNAITEEEASAYLLTAPIQSHVGGMKGKVSPRGVPVGPGPGHGPGVGQGPGPVSGPPGVMPRQAAPQLQPPILNMHPNRTMQSNVPPNTQPQMPSQQRPPPNQQQPMHGPPQHSPIHNNQSPRRMSTNGPPPSQIHGNMNQPPPNMPPNMQGPPPGQGGQGPPQGPPHGINQNRPQGPARGPNRGPNTGPPSRHGVMDPRDPRQRHMAPQPSMQQQQSIPPPPPQQQQQQQQHQQHQQQHQQQQQQHQQQQQQPPMQSYGQQGYGGGPPPSQAPPPQQPQQQQQQQQVSATDGLSEGEKRQYFSMVLNLKQQDIDKLPPDQRESMMLLREQALQSGMF